MAIIGCGAAGLAALRVFSEDVTDFPHNYSIHGFEKSDVVGGLWNYCENIEQEYISPIYRDLRFKIIIIFKYYNML